MILPRLFGASLVLVSALCGSVAASENRAYFSFGSEPRVPDCSAASVQSAVAGTLARAIPSYAGGRTITRIDDVREVAYQVNDVSPLARRYCRGKASLSDGSRKTVHYMVEEHAGFVGVSWNVEACLSPLDKWRVYGAHCSTTRPR